MTKEKETAKNLKPKEDGGKELKKVEKNVKSKDKDCHEKVEEIQKKLKEVGDDVSKKVNELKKKFEKADPETKKKIVTGVAAAAAGLAVLVKMSKHKKKK